MKNKILVIGSMNRDMNIGVVDFPQKGETILGKSLSYANGGKGANQASACAKLGGNVTMLGCVGKDENGRCLLDSLKEFGVNVEYIKEMEGIPTGIAVINITETSDNNIIVIPGANEHCDTAYLKENDELFQDTDCVLLQMEIPLESVEYSIRRARELNKIVILNPAPVNHRIDRAVLENLDYIIPNETEFEALFPKGTGEKFPHKVQPIVTLGEKGAAYFDKIQEKWISIPSYQVDAVDTVAAGDSFIGAVITGILEDSDIGRAIKYANAAAAITVTREGAQSAIPDKSEVASFIHDREGL